MSPRDDDIEREGIQQESCAAPNGAPWTAIVNTLPLPKAARMLAAQGFRVLPVHGITPNLACTCKRGAKCPDRGKRPQLKGWQNEATSATRTVARWWNRFPNANIGLAMGGDSRLVALDVDGEEGRASLAALETKLGALPPP